MDGTRLSIAPDEAPTIDDPLIGSTLDQRYEVLELVGRGGMGAVYRARQTTIGRDVAVKVVNSFALHDPSLIRRFENEARIISSLRHPNTLKLIDFGKTRDGRPYLVTEFLVGRPLERVLKQGAVDVYWIARIVRQVLDALTEAHDAGIVHRDLKPENIFVEHVAGEDIVRVLDFGIAKLGQSGNTATGTLFGTPTYMSPEQARGETAGPRSDLYSVGVILYRAIAGKPPFEGEEPMSLLLQHVNQAPVPLSHVAPQIVEPEVEALVMSLLEKDPGQRPASALATKLRIEELISKAPSGPVQRPYPTPAPSIVPTTTDPHQAAAFNTGGLSTGSLIGALEGPRLLKPVGLALFALAIGIIAGAFAIQSEDEPREPKEARAVEAAPPPRPPPVVVPPPAVAPKPAPKPAAPKKASSAKPKKKSKTEAGTKGDAVAPDGFVDFDVE
jgi:serine/threonine-protein kinase